VGLVAAAVVAEDSLEDDAAVGEPGDRVLEVVDGGLLGLVVARLDGGDEGVVVDGGVQVAGSDQHVAPLLAGKSGVTARFRRPAYRQPPPSGLG
jgi:hypothetical protein